MSHPLALDLEAMRRAGYATVDALVQRLADPRADPVLRRATADEMAGVVGGGPAPEEATPYAQVLEQVVQDVLPYQSRSDHPGYFAFVPSFTTWPAALADLIAAAANPYTGAWMESAAASHIEAQVIGWFRDWLGMPATTGGLLVSGGSAANLTAMLVAREVAGGPSENSVIYVSDQAHSSLARTGRAMGLREEQIRVLPTDARWRLRMDALAAALHADRAAGRIPIALCASAGSTNTGAVDPLADLARFCRGENLWLHVDAAYGGFAVLTDQGRALLRGIEEADSVTLDPHKWLFQPMECGSVLLRDGALLERTFAIHPHYLDDNAARAAGEIDFADRGLQLSRGFRALKIWMSIRTFGLAAFRDCVQRGLELARYAQQLVEQHPQLTLEAPATLGIVCFRREWAAASEAEAVARTTALVASLEAKGTALVSTTRLHGRHVVRLCALNPTSTADDVAAVLLHFADAPDISRPAAATPGAPTAPVLATLSPAGRAEMNRCGRIVEAGTGDVVVQRWAADRSFYVILSGRYEVDVDGVHVRTLSDGFFGELAARDWGAGYGYPRLATVRCAEPGQLLAVPAPVFHALLEHEPGLRAAVDAAVAERLPRS